MAMGVGILMAFVIPNHQPPWQNFFHEYLAALAFIPVIAAACLRGLKFPPLALVLVLLALTVWVQYFLGLIVFSGDAWLVSLYLLGGACVMAAAHSIVVSSEDAVDIASRSLWVGILLAGLLSVGIALHQWLGVGRYSVFFMEIAPNGRAYANLGQPNHLATLLLLAIVGVWVLWEKRVLMAVTASVSACLLIVGLTLTSSRTPVAAMLWMTPLLGYLGYRKWIRLPLFTLAGFAAFYLALVFNLEMIGGALYLTLPSAGAIERIASNELRLEIWADAVEAIRRAPWMGYGWFQTPIAQLDVADGTQILGQLLPSVHNLILDLVLWLGIPLSVFVLVALGWGFLAKFRFQMGIEGLASWIGVAVVINHAMLEYAELYAYFFVPACWWVGVLSDKSKSQFFVSDNGHSRAISVVRGSLLAVCGSIFLAVGWDYINYQSDWEIKRFRDALMDKSIEVPVRDALLLNHLDAQLELSAYDPFAVPRELPPKFAEDAARRFPYPSNLLKLAIIQAMKGREADASETMHKLCLLYRQVACESARATWVVVGQSRIPELSRVALKPLP